MTVSPLAEARPPPARESPPLVNEEVADEVFCMLPPLMVSPLEVKMPPGPNCTCPPKVEDAVVEVALMTDTWRDE